MYYPDENIGIVKSESFNASISKTGSRLVIDFIKKFTSNFKTKIESYAEHRLFDKRINNNSLFEHGFYYGEQQTKTYITSALDAICNSNCMQEYKVIRNKPSIKEKISQNENIGNGKLDYWCRYGNTTKISVLLEVKQSWIKYYNDDKHYIYKLAISRHASAIDQINNVNDKMSLAVDNLYGVALSVLPVFCRYKEDSDPITINKNTFEVMSENVINKIKAINNTKANICSYINIDNKLSIIDSWPYKDKTIYESHPGVLLAWSIRKFTRK
jgi:hypothetical protein